MTPADAVVTDAVKKKNPRPWRQTWYMVDLRGNVRASIIGYLPSELPWLAEALFSEPLRFLSWHLLSWQQRDMAKSLHRLGPKKIRELLGDIEIPIQPEKREKRKAAVLRRRLREQGELAAAGGAQ